MDDEKMQFGDEGPDETPLPNQPPWLIALHRFRSMELGTPDNTVTHEWLYDALGIEHPRDETPWAIARVSQLKYADQMVKLTRALLEQDKLALASLPGTGFRVLPASKQVAWAEDQGSRDLYKTMRKWRRRTANVNMEDLNEEQRTAQRDALARVGALQSLVRRSIREPVRMTD